MGAVTTETIWFGILQFATLVLILALLYRPLGDYIAHVYQSRKDLRIERGVYRLIGVDPASAQTWQAYLRGVLRLLGRWACCSSTRCSASRPCCPYSLGLPAVPEGLAFNTAVSFVTNTNWQSYSPELTMGYTVQLAGLAVQNFVSAAVGIAVAIALVRGFAARRSDTLGNFWVDLVRGIFRLLLPLSIVAAIALLDRRASSRTSTASPRCRPSPAARRCSRAARSPRRRRSRSSARTAAGSSTPTPRTRSRTRRRGRASSRSCCCSRSRSRMPRAFGKIVGDNRQGYAILGVMAAIFLVSVAVVTWLEASGSGHRARSSRAARWRARSSATASSAPTLFAGATTLTSTGAVNSMHDSYTALGGMMPMINMMLGEVAPGGVGSGLYGMLVLAVIAVFVGGLLVGRTPEYLGKKIGPREIKLASLYILVTPTLVLAGTALSFALPGVREDVESVSIWNPGVHGLSEVLYAFTSAANNNGSAFAGLTANTPWLNTALGVAMLLGRFVPIVLVLALAGSLAKQDVVPVDRRHAPDLPPAVRRAARRRRGHRHRTHLLPRTHAGSPGGRARLNMSTATLTPAPDRAPHASEHHKPRLAAFSWAQLVQALPGALRKLNPAALWRNPVMFLVWVGAALTTVIAIAEPFLGGAGRVRRHHGPARLHGGHRRLALAHRAVREPRRVGRRGPRQGAGREPAQDPHEHDRAPRRRLRRVDGCRGRAHRDDRGRLVRPDARRCRRRDAPAS